MIRNICAVIFSVSNLEKACDFYQDILGLKLSYKNTTSGWAEFDLNGIKFSLKKNNTVNNTPNENHLLASNPLVSLYTENLEQTVSKLKNKGVIFSGSGEIQCDFFGNSINMKDLDGNVINLFERVI